MCIRSFVNTQLAFTFTRDSGMGIETYAPLTPFYVHFGVLGWLFSRWH